MTAILKVDTIQDTSGNNIINESSDTITIGASGDTVTVPGTEVKSNKLSPASGTALQIGDSGDTVNIVGTLQNNGSALVTGKVLQVVSDTLTSEYTTGSASFSDTGLTLNITPSATSSKILIMVTGVGYSNTAASRLILTLLRGSTNLATGDSSGAYGFAGLTVNEGIQLVGSMAFNHLDSPSSTSQLTYKVQGRLNPASGAGQLSLNSTTSTIIAMEIGA